MQAQKQIGLEKDVPWKGEVSSNESGSKKTIPRTITRSLKVHETTDGIGSRIRRCIGNRAVRCLPPFVICEQFRMDETGRPPHPSRGAQKITYILNGKVRMEYSPANSIDLGPGDVTSLMVGRGVIRSTRAIPDEENDSGRKKPSATGIQIFMDVPESFKRMDPSHLNLCHTDLVSCEPSNGVTVKILTGSVFGKKAEQMLTTTPALILDCILKPGSSIDIPVKLDWNAFIYVVEGHLHIQGEKAQRSQYIEFMRSPRNNEKDAAQGSNGNRDNSTHRDHLSEAHVSVAVDAAAKQDARLIFCAAKPLCQPIYRQGPFVDVSMNWIHQAFDDYTSRKNGFESGDWNSHHPRSYTTDAPPKASAVADGASKTSGFNSGSNSQTSSKQGCPTCSSCSSKQQSPSSALSGDPDPNNTDDHAFWEPSPPYNPCEDQGCCDEKESKQGKKASFPNAFPPGSVNPASHSTLFNGVDGVEEQQEQKVPQRSKNSELKRRRPSDSGESDTSDMTSSSSPPPKKV